MHLCSISVDVAVQICECTHVYVFMDVDKNVGITQKVQRPGLAGRP